MLQWIQNNSQKTFKAASLIGLLLVAAFLLFSFPEPTLAQSVADQNSTLNQGVQMIEQPLGLPTADIRLIIARIVRIALGLIGIILVVLIMYAGFLWMTAGGNEDQIGKSKAIIKNAVIGLVIVLSAYGIVWFVMRVLGVGDGGAGGPNANPPGTTNFVGSGALGQVVKDHYPERNQKGVARNTKIVITFRKPIKLSDFVIDQTRDGVLGNCKTDIADWRSDCDLVTTTQQGFLSDNYFDIKNADTDESLKGAAITAVSSTIDGVPGVYTIVIKPFADVTQRNGGTLGSPTEEIKYTVHLGKDLRLDLEGNPKVFDSKRVGNDYYEWQFTCSTALDTDPPVVSSVYPDRGATKDKNTVIQIDFSEPMDPTGIQGNFVRSSDGSFYYLAGSSVFLKNENSTIPLGSFNLVNGYKTLEFTPTIECGTNACGGKVYCMPVCDKEGRNCDQDAYRILLKAATTLNSNSFEAQPFSGVMDLAGNALDGNKDNKVQKAANSGDVFSAWETPDNDYWTFNLKDEIDLVAPYLVSVYPGVDAQYVLANDPWLMVFSKRMRIEPMYDIEISEDPSPSERGDNIPLCKVPRIYLGSEITTTSMSHCAFLEGVEQTYFPVIDSRVEDASFNCFYPGKGPNERADNTKVSPNCEIDGTNCCDVTSTPSNRSFCCNGNVNPALSNSEACLNSF